MDEREFCEILSEALHTYFELGEDESDGSVLPKSLKIRDFSECGLLTNNKGLVVRVGEDTFHITVVQDHR